MGKTVEWAVSGGKLFLTDVEAESLSYEASLPVAADSQSQGCRAAALLVCQDVTRPLGQLHPCRGVCPVQCRHPLMVTTLNAAAIIP